MVRVKINCVKWMNELIYLRLSTLKLNLNVWSEASSVISVVKDIKERRKGDLNWFIVNTYRRLWMIGVKINSRLDDLWGALLKLFLSLVQDELAADLLSLSTLGKPDNPSLLCLSTQRKKILSFRKQNVKRKVFRFLFRW